MRRSGSWDEAGCGQAKHNGQWKDVQEVWVKHEGVWKKACEAVVATHILTVAKRPGEDAYGYGEDGQPAFGSITPAHVSFGATNFPIIIMSWFGWNEIALEMRKPSAGVPVPSRVSVSIAGITVEIPLNHNQSNFCSYWRPITPAEYAVLPKSGVHALQIEAIA